MCAEHDAKCAQAKVAQRHYRVRLRAFTSDSKNSINFNRMLEECQILLSLQETFLEVCEAKLAKEHARGLYSFDGRDLPGKLEELHTRVAEFVDERTTEAGKLLTLVVGITNALVDHGMLPIRDIPLLLKMPQEVLAAAGLILKHLQEEHASDADPWD
jgi:hypothetical protein